ncbi:MAG TPA: hypothetical protein VMS02_09665 [Solirubrobacteraceae bacterium]|nr:hypothetical protein [Solirubrobacteraceae bacterium]
MSDQTKTSPQPDVSLLLRAHAEQRLLSREVVPVVRQIETRERLPEEQLPAALAYLEVIWADCRRRAAETDRARRVLEQPGAREQPLWARACRYHSVLVDLREAVARRVAPLLHTDAVDSPAGPLDAGPVGEWAVGSRS